MKRVQMVGEIYRVINGGLSIIEDEDLAAMVCY